MKVGAAFPSKYLKHSDLEGRNVNVTIKSYDIEDVGDGEKPILYFRQGKKGLVLNRINGETIAEILGTDEMDEWIGQTVCLFPDKTSFQGKRVDCIRVKAATAAKPAPAAKQRRAPEPAAHDTSDDDDREPVLGGDDDDDIPGWD